ncbi:MAG TPA: exodeoxyribonuclease VII small subunit [Terriglobales bacterium]|nr:exodeoxyribonuclease VII small subunit [Terriglobales bacterium]
MAEEIKIQRFDEGVAQLEAIVKKLESGDLPLEDALQAFESGIGLVRVLSERLTAAEAQVELLTRGTDGSMRLQPMPREEDEE